MLTLVVSKTFLAFHQAGFAMLNVNLLLVIALICDFMLIGFFFSMLNEALKLKDRGDK